MKSMKRKVLSLLVASGMLAAAGATAIADTSWSPWKFSGVSSTHDHANLTVAYYVDPSWLPDRTRAVGLDVVPSASFGVSQQCWNGAYAHHGSVPATYWGRTIDTPQCSTAQGGTASGRVGIFH